MRAQAGFFEFFLTRTQFETMKPIAKNGWGLTKFCLLPNFKNMRKPKGKILFKPLLAAVASTKLATKDRTFFVLNIFLAGLLFFS